MKKTVYLFGAGASHSYNGSINKVNPPLAKDFFKTFNKLKISKDILVRVGAIISYVAKTRNLDENKFGSWNEDIEAFLTELDDNILTDLDKIDGELTFNSLSNNKILTDIKAYDQMIFLFTSVLNEVQNGEVCSNYSKLVNLLNEGDTLITFNWDTILDRALYENGIWNIEDGYDIRFKAIFRDGWEKDTIRKKSKVKLLKLHGSTNWLMPYYSVNFETKKRGFSNINITEKDHPIYCFHYNTKAYETYDNRSFDDKKYTPFSYYYYPPNIPLKDYNNHSNIEQFSIGIFPDVSNYSKVKKETNNNYSMPFIIPPVKYKDYGLMDGLLNSLWDSAEKSISECDEMFIIGYSFPITDTKAWKLLKESFDKRDEYPKVTIVDPYPENIIKRIYKEFPKLTNVTVYPITFDMFISDKI